MQTSREYFRIWFTAARPHTLSASLVPVVVGGALAATRFDGWLFLVVLMAALLVQIGTNLTDEYADHQATASVHKYLAPHKVIARGLLSQQAVRFGAWAAFAAATVMGAWLVWRTGWPLLLVCLLGLAAAYAYSAGPFPLGDYALGEPVVFVMMGPVMVGGTYYVLTGQFGWDILWVGLPVAGLVTAILMANNLRDEREDRRNGRRTIATVFGARAVRAAYHLMLLLAYLCLPAAVAGGAHTAWLMLPWLTLPLALRVAGWIRAGRERDTLHRALRGTSALHLLFGLILAAALVAEANF